jgi:hypothetical protein
VRKITASPKTATSTANKRLHRSSHLKAAARARQLHGPTAGQCRKGRFRYENKSRQVGSLLLGLYDSAGKPDHVGFTSTLGDAERPALTRKLEKLRGLPGFTGKAPGGPSRWSTERSGEWESLRPELVVEVRFDHVTGDRFRHGTKLMRWRPDKALESRGPRCTSPRQASRLRSEGERRAVPNASLRSTAVDVTDRWPSQPWIARGSCPPSPKRLAPCNLTSDKP